MTSKSRLHERRSFLAGLAATLAGVTLQPVASVIAAESQSKTPQFTANTVNDIAKALSEHPFIPPMQVPERLLKLDYDRYRQIRFNPNAAIWAGSKTKFTIQMFAPGLFFKEGIDVYTVENGVAKVIQLDKNSFITPGSDLSDLLAQLNKVAGFRLHYPLNTPKYQDEIVEFQGASYFRALSKGQNYGLSARGLAIDVAEPSGEEFPLFRTFWIERPANKADNIVFHALLDSKRVTGAYHFNIYPGDTTKLDVKATLYPRTKLNHVGIGSLTSMFFFGGIDRPDVPDYRNAVHDSDGLAILNGQGEYIWRPLNNPKTLQVSAFVDKDPKGFGLVQRAREQRDYEDLQANYHKRPSAWITPTGNWGEGYVVLVEIPSAQETNDNIVAYWRPKQALEPGTPFEFGYQLTWPNDSPLPSGFGRVRRTSSGIKLFTQFPQVVIDFMDLPAGIKPEDVHITASVSSGRVLETQAEPNGPNGLRVYMTFDTDGAPLTEIRVQPRSQGKPIGETMLFRWLPQ
ncbi:MAG TPA: glucan biosynthesis protein G [Candidatus Acidoferrum sp.]|nr:glucan biosynthesis protein G [Candidatus Acidoferrum sp.]